MNNNQSPLKIHLVGVGGAAMGNLAAMLKAAGHTVTGSDVPLYPPMSHRLKEWGIEVLPFDAENVKRSDLNIIGNVISRGNVEVEEILNSRLPYESMSRALHDFFLIDKQVIVVSGTHGKTTTTFLMDHILTCAGKPSGLFAGGIRADGHPGFRLSDSPYFVIEGDEYDTAFFDKAAKFLHYKPYYLIITSVEYDHADIYAAYGDYAKAFQRLTKLVPSKGCVVGCADDSGVVKLLYGYKLSKKIFYRAVKGKSKVDDAQLCKHEGGRDVYFSSVGKVKDFSLMGYHNMRNAIAASLVAKEIGIDDECIVRALQTFQGVTRRQEIRKTINIHHNKNDVRDIIFIEDFAHHPTAVRETIEGVRLAYPNYKIHVLFEPRSASSHRAVFQKSYVKAFKKADAVYLCEVFNLDKVPKSERLNVKKMTRLIDGAVYGENPLALLDALKRKFKASKKGDVILVMSNGSFGGIYTKIEEWLDELLIKKSPT